MNSISGDFDDHLKNAGGILAELEDVVASVDPKPYGRV
jgi:hypothetical protein